VCLLMQTSYVVAPQMNRAHEFIYSFTKANESDQYLAGLVPIVVEKKGTGVKLLISGDF
jgi:hypothetical protein